MIEIPNYKIIEKSGEGRLSTVYLAEHKVLGRQLALKVFSADQSKKDKGFKHLFLKKARAYANLEHKHIPHVHDIGIHGNSLFYIATDYFSRGSLRDRLRTQSIEFEEAVKVITEVASALDYAHSKGVIHCDITPSNILFSDKGSALLSGFSIAKSETCDRELDSSEVSSFDIYRLGLVFYEMVDGSEIDYEDVFDSPPQLPAKLSYLQAVIDKVLAPSSKERYLSAKGFAQSIKKEERLVKEAALTISQPDESAINIIADRELYIEPSSYVLETKNNVPWFAKWVFASLAIVGLLLGLFLYGVFDQPNTQLDGDVIPLNTEGSEVNNEGELPASAGPLNEQGLAQNTPTVRVGGGENTEEEETVLLKEIEIIEPVQDKEPKESITPEPLPKVKVRVKVVSTNTNNVLRANFAVVTTLGQKLVAEQKDVQDAEFELEAGDYELLVKYNGNIIQKKPLIIKGQAVEDIIFTYDTVPGALMVKALDTETRLPLQAEYFIKPEKGKVKPSKTGNLVRFELLPGKYTLLAKYQGEDSQLQNIIIKEGEKLSKTLLIKTKNNKKLEAATSDKVLLEEPFTKSELAKQGGLNVVARFGHEEGSPLHANFFIYHKGEQVAQKLRTKAASFKLPEGKYTVKTIYSGKAFEKKVSIENGYVNELIFVYKNSQEKSEKPQATIESTSEIKENGIKKTEIKKVEEPILNGKVVVTAHTGSNTGDALKVNFSIYQNGKAIAFKKNVSTASFDVPSGGYVLRAEYDNGSKLLMHEMEVVVEARYISSPLFVFPDDDVKLDELIADEYVGDSASIDLQESNQQDVSEQEKSEEGGAGEDSVIKEVDLSIIPEVEPPLAEHYP